MVSPWRSSKSYHDQISAGLIFLFLIINYSLFNWHLVLQCSVYWSVFHFLQLLVPPPLITVPTNDLTWWSSDAATRSHQRPLSIHLVSEHTRIEKARSLHLYHPTHLKIDEWTNAASSKSHLSLTPATFKSKNEIRVKRQNQYFSLKACFWY